MRTLTQPEIQPPVSIAPTAARMAEITAVRQRRDEIEGQLEEAIDHGFHDSGRKRLRCERNELNKRLEALETMGDGGPLLTVMLDAYASFLVRRSMATHHASCPADVVNGAVAFTCGEDDDHDWPEEMHKAADRRAERSARSGVLSILDESEGSKAQPVHRITLELSPVQLRMFGQIMDMRGGGTMAEIVRAELGRHVCLHLECYHGHDLDAALARWESEGKGEA